MPSSKDDCCPLKNQLLVCYWTLGETEYLTLDYQVVMEPRRLILKEALFDPLNHYTGHMQQHCGMSGSNVCKTRLKRVLKVQVSCMSNWLRFPWFLSLLTVSSVSIHTSGLLGISLGPTILRKTKFRPGYRWAFRVH